ncbi:hypothetical protein A3Q56_05906 [Intoshia linei]|uniref:Uncharacterized protein n=1 Tax=Intoshia linei TaxID=1819745 RepID=A0A177AY65_9BILA|nr:hypothetical protein A3Q56_05906 [Intoshia linei]
MKLFTLAQLDFDDAMVYFIVCFISEIARKQSKFINKMKTENTKTKYKQLNEQNQPSKQNNSHKAKNIMDLCSKSKKMTKKQKKLVKYQKFNNLMDSIYYKEKNVLTNIEKAKYINKFYQKNDNTKIKKNTILPYKPCICYYCINSHILQYYVSQLL